MPKRKTAARRQATRGRVTGRTTTPPGRTRRRSRQRRATLVVLGAFTVVAAGSLFAVTTSSGSSGGGSTPKGTTDASAVADITSRPAFSQIVYQVDDSLSGSSSTSFEVLTDTRPFVETDLKYPTNPLLGAKPSSGTESTETSDYSLSSGELQLVAHHPPSVADGDEALGVELTDLAGRGLMEPLDQGLTVAGRVCELYRFSAPPNGPVTTFTGSDHDDLCIDGDGLVLSESWTYGGKVVLQRTAVDVNLTSASPDINGGPALTMARSATGPSTVTTAAGVNSASQFLAPLPSPTGWAVSAPVSVTVTSPTKAGTAIDSSTVWAFSNGGSLLTVEAGKGQLPWQSGDTPTEPLTLDHLGAATSALESSGPEIRVSLPGGRWVRVDGTITLAQLTQYASAIQSAAG